MSVNFVKKDSIINMICLVIKKGKKTWTWLTRKESDIYRPVITAPEWDDPYWEKKWVEDNAVTSAEPSEMESSLMTIEGTIFDSMRNGYAVRHTSAEGELMDLEIDEILPVMRY